MLYFPIKQIIIIQPLIMFILIIITYKEQINNYNFNNVKSRSVLEKSYIAFLMIMLVQAFINKVVLNINSTESLTISAIPILTIFFVPITEEVLYRKIIFKWIYEKSNFWLAAVLSSTLFAISHFNTYGWLGYFLAGLIWCWTYKQTNDISILIISHIFINLAVCIGGSLK